MDDVPIKAGEHVFRMRRRCKLDDFQSRFDDGDVYDGPFVVTEVDDNQRAFSRRNGHSLGLGSTRQTKVRLNFHPEAQASPWVPVPRVRRALEVPRECTAGMTNAEKWDAAVAASTAGRSGRASTGVQYVCKIDEEHFVVGKVVAPDSLGDLQYHVDRLRRKKIVIGSRLNFANEPADDDDVQAYLSAHGPLKPGEVAVVQYRVHWAGWPSEDDTWERGHGNISPHFIEAFRAHHAQETIFPTKRN
jgi:Chromo (CHRromatin Organisation MOdifier) domain